MLSVTLQLPKEWDTERRCRLTARPAKPQHVCAMQLVRSLPQLLAIISIGGCATSSALPHPAAECSVVLDQASLAGTDMRGRQMTSAAPPIVVAGDILAALAYGGPHRYDIQNSPRSHCSELAPYRSVAAGIPQDVKNQYSRWK